MSKEYIQQRLQSLKTEYMSGQQMLTDLEAKQANLRETMLRISGAIQVLQELLDEGSEIAENGDGQPQPSPQSEPLVP